MRTRRRNGKVKCAWRRAAESYPCIACGAGPGRACVTIGGTEAHTPHSARTDLASRNLWRPADYTPKEDQ